MGKSLDHRNWNEKFMSTTWKKGQDHVVIHLKKGGITRGQLIDLKCPSLVGAGKLSRVMEALEAKTLEELAKVATPDDILNINGVGETTVAVFCHLLLDLTKIRPWRWLDEDVKLNTRKERIKRKKKS